MWLGEAVTWDCLPEAVYLHINPLTHYNIGVLSAFIIDFVLYYQLIFQREEEFISH